MRMATSSAISSSSMCRRPAVSTISVSNPSVFAAASAPAARATGSISSAGSCTRTPTCSASTDNCWIAAGRRTSVETSIGWRPCFCSHRASFADVVVLPDPCSPSIKTTRGMRDRRRQSARRVAEQRQHLVAHDAHDLLCRRQAPQNRFADRLRPNPIDERLDDAEVDVRFEQREPNLPQRDIDGRLGQPRLAAERLEDVLQAGAERFEHTGRDTPPRTRCP